MDAAAPHIVPTASLPRLDADRVRDIVLLRLAVGGRASTRDSLCREFSPIIAHAVPPDGLRAVIDRELAALADAGLAEMKAVGVAPTDAGIKRAAIVLGGRAPFPRTWAEARDTRLIAKALGLENDATGRLRKLAKPDGLRAAIVVKAFGLKLRGAPTPVRVRTALAKLALSRAFGGKAPPGTESRSGLSARAGRALAGQLSQSPRDFRTDSRLMAALAAEHVGAAKGDLQALQIALLRRYVTKGEAPKAATTKSRSRPPRKPPSAIDTPGVPLPHDHANPPTAPVGVVPTPRVPPTMTAFANDVLAFATAVAEGFTGNRRAFISRVWRRIEAHRPHWGLSEIEFKCMLAEAHRVGQLVLANADLKDDRNIADVQASAVSYKNAVFHYVRVDT